MKTAPVSFGELRAEVGELLLGRLEHRVLLRLREALALADLGELPVALLDRSSEVVHLLLEVALVAGLHGILVAPRCLAELVHAPRVQDEPASRDEREHEQRRESGHDEQALHPDALVSDHVLEHEKSGLRDLLLLGPRGLVARLGRRDRLLEDGRR
ncbi:hypothetical protein HY251_04910 [bacterium]|nr:hypothetical protein [bacterium]